MTLWWILKLAPKNALSRLTGRLVRVRFPGPIRLWLLKKFAAKYNLNLVEAEKPIEQYDTIQELFTRKLKSHCRPLGLAPIVHPADATLTARGTIRQGQLLQVKGIEYTVSDLLNDPEFSAASFEGGAYFTYYLCPTDYHRVHSPVEGVITRIQGLTGELWPVNEWSVSRVPKLFAINERVNFWIRSERGVAVLSMVGATNVGEVSTPLWPEFRSNRNASHSKIFEPPLKIGRGEEIGTFHLGSTVILLFQPSWGLKVEIGPPLVTRVRENLF